MSKYQVELAKDFRDYVHERVQFLVQSLSIITPLTEEDSKAMRIGIDMIQTIDEKLQNASTAYEFGEILNLEDIEESWPMLKQQLNGRVDGVMDRFSVNGLDRYKEECLDDEELPFT